MVSSTFVLGMYLFRMSAGPPDILTEVALCRSQSLRDIGIVPQLDKEDFLPHPFQLTDNSVKAARI